MHAGWGTGFAISYGVARAIQISLGLAYYRFQVVGQLGGLDSDAPGSSVWDEVRQTSVSVDLQSPSQSWLRAWLSAGLGVYEMTETRKWTETYYLRQYHYRYVESGTRLGASWGVGLSARLDKRLGIDLGGRYHHSFGSAFMTNNLEMDGARLLSVQAGLSYVIH